MRRASLSMLMGQWIAEHAGNKEDKHLLWPWPRDVNKAHAVEFGFVVQRRTPLAIMCERAHGKPTGDQRYAICTCDAYLDNCIAPAHIKWATIEERQANTNARGSNRNGEDHPASKLTDAMVVEIVSSDDPAAWLAQKFGVSRRTIVAIRTGRAWKHVPRPTKGAWEGPDIAMTVPKREDGETFEIVPLDQEPEEIAAKLAALDKLGIR